MGTHPPIFQWCYEGGNPRVQNFRRPMLRRKGDGFWGGVIFDLLFLFVDIEFRMLPLHHDSSTLARRSLVFFRFLTSIASVRFSWSDVILHLLAVIVDFRFCKNRLFDILFKLRGSSFDLRFYKFDVGGPTRPGSVFDAIFHFFVAVVQCSMRNVPSSM